MYLLDTNTCIYFLKNSFPTLTQRLLNTDPSELFVSSITVFELAYGAEKSKWGEKTRQKLAMFLAPFTILPFDGEDAMVAGRIRGALEQRGIPIGPYDVQIAAQALAKGLTVLTHNLSEFQRKRKINPCTAFDREK